MILKISFKIFKNNRQDKCSVLAISHYINIFVKFEILMNGGKKVATWLKFGCKLFEPGLVGMLEKLEMVIRTKVARKKLENVLEKKLLEQKLLEQKLL